jgi:PIN domain
MPRPSGMRKTKLPELKVVLDSNAIYNSSESYLLSHEVHDLICESARHADLIITWYLPETVRHERRYQMQRRGRDLVPPIQKLERLLGHNLNITEEIISQRIQEGIDRQIAELKIQILPVDSSKVDWDRIMLDAVYRRPPFASGEKEKGFRDALICEAFAQLVSLSPTTPKVCRIALVTEDGLLAEAVRAQTDGCANVRILPTIEELKGLINTLVSEVSEEFVADIKAKASSYFFEPGQKDSLYYRENIWQRIAEKFSTELLSLPEGADERELEKTLIRPPGFVRKEQQRVFWVSQITVQVKAYKRDQVDPLTALIGGGSTVKPGVMSSWASAPIDVSKLPNLSRILGKPASDLWPALSPIQSEARDPNAGILGSPGSWSTPPPKRLFKSGQIIFEITWSVSVSTKKRSFSKATIESVEYIETAWE